MSWCLCTSVCVCVCVRVCLCASGRMGMCLCVCRVHRYVFIWKFWIWFRSMGHHRKLWNCKLVTSELVPVGNMNILHWGAKNEELLLCGCQKTSCSAITWHQTYWQVAKTAHRFPWSLLESRSHSKHAISIAKLTLSDTSLSNTSAAFDRTTFGMNGLDDSSKWIHVYVWRVLNAYVLDSCFNSALLVFTH